jgi:hypothetical protein
MISDVVSDIVDAIELSSDAFGSETVSTIDPSMDSATTKGPPDSNISSTSVSAHEESSPPGQIVSVDSSPRFVAHVVLNNHLVTDDDKSSNQKTFHKRRSRDEMDSQAGDETDTPSDCAKAQQETEKENDESFYRYETEMQSTILSHRNKRVLLSRLFEVAPRGNLTVVRISAAVFFELVNFAFY